MNLHRQEWHQFNHSMSHKWEEILNILLELRKTAPASLKVDKLAACLHVFKMSAIRLSNNIVFNLTLHLLSLLLFLRAESKLKIPANNTRPYKLIFQKKTSSFQTELSWMLFLSWQTESFHPASKFWTSTTRRGSRMSSTIYLLFQE